MRTRYEVIITLILIFSIFLSGCSYKVVELSDAKKQRLKMLSEKNNIIKRKQLTYQKCINNLKQHKDISMVCSKFLKRYIDIEQFYSHGIEIVNEKIHDLEKEEKVLNAEKTKLLNSVKSRFYDAGSWILSALTLTAVVYFYGMMIKYGSKKTEVNKVYAK